MSSLLKFTPLGKIEENGRAADPGVTIRRLPHARSGPFYGAAETRVRARGPFFFRGAEKLILRGVTYGPFRPDAAGEHFPPPERARSDLLLMRDFGIDSVRIYYPPPGWFADLAAEAGLSLLVGIPWPEHVCRFGEARFERSVRRTVSDAVARTRGHPAVFGYLVGNEIPATNVRWHGPRVVERFLAELYAAAKEADPEALVSYANYPSTEYLSLEPFDFYTLNLYLHDREKLRRYLARMRNMAGDKPFILGEFGIDTIREGERAQAEIVRFSLEEAYAIGCAGAYVFSFTDEWFRGGEEVRGWAFGLTDRERRPRPAALAAREIFRAAPEVGLARAPRVSVVVATYNGGATLRETLETLGRLRYPDYEVIVIDDGSKDDSAAIAREFLSNPIYRLIQQENRGLSAARNRGIEAASGEIVAFCDSDVAVDPHWLYFLVAALVREGPGCAGGGGPNLAPPGDGRVAAAVSACPGGPAHVLVDDLIAEHVPGCNMAFWKKALDEVSGFDPRFRAAGDDVDMCWRLQDRGYRLFFAPSAIVWHHRRNSARAYLRQQRGYGEAEAELQAKHPGRYNAVGGALWRGRIYGATAGGAFAPRRRRIHYGIFGLGLFQAIYQPENSLMAALAAMPECALAGAAAIAAGAFSGSAFFFAIGALFFAAHLAAALRHAVRARLEPACDGIGTRALVFFLSLCQPWVRRVAQLRRARALARRVRSIEGLRVAWFGEIDAEPTAFWSEEGREREAFLGSLESSLAADRFPVRRGTGFEPFDLVVAGERGGRALVSSVMEYHGGPKRLLRLRVDGAIGPFASTLLIGMCLGAIALARISAEAASAAFLATFVTLVFARQRASWLRRAVVARAAETARSLGFVPAAAERPRGFFARLPSLFFGVLS
jgi:GT2 family glycosyltransferase